MEEVKITPPLGSGVGSGGNGSGNGSGGSNGTNPFNQSLLALENGDINEGNTEEQEIPLEF